MNEIMNSPVGGLLALAVYSLIFALVMSIFVKRQNAKLAEEQMQEAADYYRIVWADNGHRRIQCFTPEETQDALDSLKDEDEVLVLKAESVYYLGQRID